MKYALAILTGLALVAGTTGCNTLGNQPVIRSAGIEPAQLKPGDSAVVLVTVADRHDIIDRVIGKIEGYPDIDFVFEDDGNPPDEAAGDDVWSVQVDVPVQAPPGRVAMDITAYNSSGEKVLVKTDSGTGPLTVSASAEISLPAEM